MKITTLTTGYTLVSPAVPNRAVRKSSIAYTGVGQKRSERIKVPVKCFYVEIGEHRFVVEAGIVTGTSFHCRKYDKSTGLDEGTVRSARVFGSILCA